MRRRDYFRQRPNQDGLRGRSQSFGGVTVQRRHQIHTLLGLLRFRLDLLGVHQGVGDVRESARSAARRLLGLHEKRPVSLAADVLVFPHGPDCPRGACAGDTGAPRVPGRRGAREVLGRLGARDALPHTHRLVSQGVPLLPRTVPRQAAAVMGCGANLRFVAAIPV